MSCCPYSVVDISLDFIRCPFSLYPKMSGAALGNLAFEWSPPWGVWHRRYRVATGIVSFIYSDYTYTFWQPTWHIRNVCIYIIHILHIYIYTCATRSQRSTIFGLFCVFLTMLTDYTQAGGVVKALLLSFLLRFEIWSHESNGSKYWIGFAITVIFIYITYLVDCIGELVICIYICIYGSGVVTEPHKINVF